MATKLHYLSTYLRSTFDRVGHDREDVRGGTFVFCEGAVATNLMIVNFILAMEQNQIPRDMHRQVLGLVTGDVKKNVNTISHFQRLGLMSLLQFYIDNLLSILLLNLDGTRPPREYGKKVKLLLDRVSVSRKEDSEKELNIIQHMRNSLHNNGIHNNPDASVTVHGYRFEFKRGEEVRCAGWGHLCLAGVAITDVLEKIVKSPEVRKIPGPLPIRYLEPQSGLDVNNKDRV